MQLVHDQDRDSYLSVLYMPAAVRPFIFALYAFQCELVRIQETVTNPALGEIRLQWWHDLLQKNCKVERTSHPVAQELLNTLDTFSFSPEPFQTLIEAHSFDLYNEPMSSFEDVKDYCRKTTSVTMSMIARVLSGTSYEPSENFIEAVCHAGIASGLIGIIRGFPWHIRKGIQFISKDLQERYAIISHDMLVGVGEEPVVSALLNIAESAREHRNIALSLLDTLTKNEKRSLLLLCLVPSYCSLVEKENFNPFHTHLEIPFWKKHWLLWREHRRI